MAGELDLSKCPACGHEKHFGRTCAVEVSATPNGEGLLEPVRCPCSDADARKANRGKPSGFRLIPPAALVELAAVYAYGAQKYAPDSWRGVPNATEAYEEAFWRHFLAWKAGEERDAESKLRHLAHALWNVVALVELTRESARERGG